MFDNAELAKAITTIQTVKPPVIPTDAERTENPRARSAKLRAAERIEDAA